jgi:hypothetical protein
LDALIPILYLRGISSGDFQETLSALLGKDAPNLSPAVLGRLSSRLVTVRSVSGNRWSRHSALNVYVQPAPRLDDCIIKGSIKR